MSAVVFLLVCFLSCSVSEDQQITAQPGDDVTLPCEAPYYVTIAVVQWSRSDLDLKKRVYLLRDGHLNTADQDPSYVNRVQLKDNEMKNGELSLILKNVNNNDEGTYVCRYVEETATQIKFISTVYLKVTGGEYKHQHLGIILTVSLIAVGLVGLVIQQKLKGHSENNLDLPVDDPVALQQLQVNENSQKTYSDKETQTDNK